MRISCAAARQNGSSCPPGRARLDVAVSSNDVSTGAFDITHGDLVVTPLSLATTRAQRCDGAIDEAGGSPSTASTSATPTAATARGPSVEIFVTTPEAPTSRKGKKRDPGLDVEIELIDPVGASQTVDLEAVGDGERATVDGSAGQYLIVVRDHGAGTGQFEIAATEVAYTELPLGEVVESDVETTGVPAVYAVDVRAGSDVAIAVTPTEDLDAVVEVFGPTGGGTSTDSGVEGDEERVTLFGDAGRYLVVVSGYQTSTGGFELIASDVTSTALEIGQAADGEVESPDGRASYALDVPADSDVGVTVTPSGELDAMIEIVDASGASTVIDHFGPGRSEMADLTGAGHLVRVSGYDGSVGIVRDHRDAVGRRRTGRGRVGCCHDTDGGRGRCRRRRALQLRRRID